VLNPLISSALSLWLFGEHFTDDPATVALGGCAFAGLVVGVVLLTATGPELPRRVRSQPQPAEP
jgi:hypothetical protein